MRTLNEIEDARSIHCLEADLQPGPKLDALIAEKVFGWNPIYIDNLNLDMMPQYSTSITAAWPIVERFNLYVAPAAAQLQGWDAGPTTKQGRWPVTKDAVTAATAPLAICLMALKITEESKSQS